MGEALVRGLYKSYSIFVCETNPERAKYLKEEYNASVTNISEVIRNAQVIILAVKPQDMQAAFSLIRADDLREDKLFISIAAGLTTEYFEKSIKNIVLLPNPRVVRAMPNMPALIGKGITGICKGQDATDEDLKTAEEILRALGETLRVNEDMMDAITAVSGSGPAYVFLFVEQWINAAIELGFERPQARELVYKTLLGSAHLLEQSSFDVDELRVKVTSKGGTTQAAMDVFFEDNKFAKLMKDALLAAKKRSKELAK